VARQMEEAKLGQTPDRRLRPIPHGVVVPTQGSSFLPDANSGGQHRGSSDPGPSQGKHGLTKMDVLPHVGLIEGAWQF